MLLRRTSPAGSIACSRAASSSERRVGPEQGLRDAATDVSLRHAGSGDDRIDAARQSGERFDSGACKAAIRFRHSDDHRFRHCDADVRCDAVDGRDLELAGAGAHGADRREQGGARDLAAAGNDEDAALGLLAAVDDCRQRICIEGRPVEPGVAAHRVPAIASGADVLGAPSTSSCAPWFHCASTGHAQAVGVDLSKS